ncbi:non-ribosomal peptide synthetase/MFS transporter [Micromonospora echinaurantiaca]|uniref:non-ribosomal peptide synthetase/MFS transporter n=1 Tax=Micromonospora echinaurantiaca TaxID=47857 RepID=UPI003433DF13
MSAAPESAAREVPLSATKQALLERLLRQPADTGAGRVGRAPADAPRSLSYAQERLWFADQFATGSTAYHVPVAVWLDGEVDPAALGGALGDVTARQESLRMRFPAADDGQPTVVVDPPGPVPLSRATVTADDPDDARRQAGQLAREHATDPFDLGTGPLFRALLVEYGPRRWLLSVQAHHIVSDGWSIDVLVGDVLTAYRARRAGAAPDWPALPVGYGDYAHWQRHRPGTDRGLAYWTGQLAGVPALDLPTDRPRPPTQRFDGATHRFEVDAPLAAAVTALARRHDATVYMTLLAAYQVLLAGHSDQRDFAVGSPVAGRGRPELEPLVGMFVNMLALRARLDPDESFSALLTRTRQLVLDGLTHQDVQFEHLVSELDVPRDVSRSPLFQVTFALQNYQFRDHGAAGAGPAVSWEVLDLSTTRFDLELLVVQTRTGELWCEFTYNTALFDAATVARFGDRFTRLLRTVVDRADDPLRTVDLLTDAERAEVLDGWGARAARFPVQRTLHSLFEEQAARRPDAVALTVDGQQVSYAELNRRADRLAERLRRLGVGPDTLVALHLRPGPGTVTAILGVLKAGGAYVPLNLAYPRERLEFILADTGAPVLVTDAAPGDDLPTHAGRVLRLDAPDDDPPAPAAPVAARPPGPGDLAYVIYTSGSTGQPKGVLVEHRQVVRLLTAAEAHFDFGPDDVWALLHSYAFDFSVWEMWGALAYGGRLVVVPPEVIRDTERLLDVLAEQRVTVLNQTPAAFRGLRATLTETDRSFADLSVRTIVFGGDALYVRELRHWLSRYGEDTPALVNMYGITETTVHVTAQRLRRADVRRPVASPIGRPLADLRAYVLDRHLNPVPVGVPGELFVAGEGLARGYLNRAALTAERFLPEPFSGEPGARMYRTGDRVRWCPDGTLEYLGRVDRQVKVRGYRIELGEIEATLQRHPDLRGCAVLAQPDGTGDRRLVAYVVPADAGRRPTSGQLREHLARSLADYLVPAAFVVLDALPLTPNGKLDHRALPDPDLAGQAEQEFAAPGTPTERLIVEVWTDLLPVDRVSIDDDFFLVGGHSLLAAQAVTRIRRGLEAAGATGTISLMDLFRCRTVRELARLLDEPATAARPARLLHELTRPVPDAAHVRSLVCVPYGGGSAAVYQALADAMPPGHRLYSAAIHGQEAGGEQDTLPFGELVDRAVTEILRDVGGPLVLYGHCGIGSALVVEVARRLQAAGRPVEAVYVGGIFPFARPRGLLSRLSRLAELERFRSNRTFINRLVGRGVDIEELGLDEADRVIRNMRHDTRSAEDYYSGLLDSRIDRIDAPVISVVGEQDPATDYYAERFREWDFLSDTCALVVLDEGGHYFNRYRATELAEIVTRTHLVLDADDGAELTRPARGADSDWWLHGVHRRGAAGPGGPGDDGPPADAGPSRRPAEPSMGRFLGVAAGQLVSLIGSAFTQWAIPIWIYLTTGSVAQLALFVTLALVPGLVVAPLAGAVVDRSSRRAVLLAGDVAAWAVQIALGVLLWTDTLQIWHIYALLVGLSVATAFQRLAYVASVPQLVPKRYLRHAIGVVEMVNGVGTLFVPLFAAGLLATVGLDGILMIDIVSYAAAVLVVALVRWPARMGWHRRETLTAEIANGFRYSWGHRHFRAMLLFFLVLNIFLAPPLILVSPLVLSFGTLADAAQVSFVSGLGATVAGLTVALWGGPARRPMRGVLLSILAMAVACVVIALRPDPLLVAAGTFGLTAGLTLTTGIYRAIVQVKIPQRYHGRAAALNQMISWSTLPLGFAVVAPAATALFEPMLMPDGRLAGSVGRLIGVGEGRGIAFVFLLCGLVIAVLVAVAARIRAIARFDTDAPDAVADDLVGVESLRHRREPAGVQPVVPSRPRAGSAT